MAPDRGVVRAGAVVVLAAALWPLVQLSFSKAFHSDPWKLGGWAMYVTPTSMRISVRLGTQVISEGKFDALGCQRARHTFVGWRSGFGSLIEPRELGACVASASKWAGPFVVQVMQVELDGTTQRMSGRAYVYHYD